MNETILTNLGDGILLLQFNRPEKKNALNLAMYSALADHIEGAANDDAVRVIVLTGTGGCFTSGNDIVDFESGLLAKEPSPAMRFLMALFSLQKPVIAAVDGPAIGIGTTMLLHCDLVYAATNAVFQLPFVNLGLCPEAGSSLLLPQLAGYQRAAELLLLGEPFSAEAAREAGLVNALCPDEQVLGTALAKARQVSALPPAAVRLTKSLMKRHSASALRQTMIDEAAFFMERLRSPEAREAVAAFRERRKPDFTKFPL
jgi:enoyl-CoA hydratase/carnithine racemase